jgi:hypothetical protein
MGASNDAGGATALVASGLLMATVVGRIVRMGRLVLGETTMAGSGCTRTVWLWTAGVAGGNEVVV